MRILSLVLLSLLTSSTIFGFSHTFEQMWDEMDRFHEQIEKQFFNMRQTIKSSFARAKENEENSPALAMHPTPNGVEIRITGIHLANKNLNAHYDHDENSLTLELPQTLFRLQAAVYANHTQLTLSGKQQTSKDDAQKELSSYSHVHLSQTFNGELELEHAQLEYDEAMEQITINVGHRKKRVTQIPLVIKDGKTEK